MHKEKILKRVTVGSVLLLCFALVFSYKNQLQLLAEFPAAVTVTPELTPTPVTTPTPVPSLMPTPTPTMPPVPTELPVQGVWAQVAGAQESDLVLRLSEEGIRTIVIEKRGEAYNGVTVMLEEAPVDRQLSIIFKGLEEGGFAPDQLCRISEETFYKGNPPSPTPTPTATPTPSVTLTPTPKPSVTPTPTPTPTMSPDDPLYFWRFDPVKAMSVTTWQNEDGTSDVTLLLTLDKTYVYELAEDENNYYISLLRPKDVYDKIIVLDAGHGGYDPGTLTRDGKYLEKTINLNVVLYLKELFEQNPDIRVYCTRTTDRRLNLKQRIQLANDVEADFFLSVHCNSNESGYLKGTEVLYSAAQNSWTGMNSKKFAQLCMDKLSEYVGLHKRGLVPRDHNLTVLHDAQVPAALAELGFMSNRSDMEQLAKEETQRNAAQALYEAILNAYEQMAAE